jgi:MYXO-CTERM domain-containing protein
MKTFKYTAVATASTIILIAGCTDPIRTTDGDDKIKLLAYKSGLWTQREIPVCWLNPEAANADGRAWSQQAIAGSWEAVVPMRFTGWGPCDARSSTVPGIQILIDDGAFVQSGGAPPGNPWSYLGKTTPSAGKPNMLLNLSFDRWCPTCKKDREFSIRAIAIHEFGHALGFDHEQNRSDNPGQCPRDAVGGGDLLLGAYDPTSVMNYCATSGWNNNGKLSPGDVAGVQAVYGVRCGNGILDTGEACDDGNASNTDGCSTTCAVARCGDGLVQTGVEACDDGNGSNDDACTTTCRRARCGDAIVQLGVEACDDGNFNDNDGCTSKCNLVRCGDGIVEPGVEECDDGNKSDNDACTNRCTVARCTDGVVQAGIEECDDGNVSNQDGCTNRCTVAACGDGIIQTGMEECDDGNRDELDGCSNQCRRGTCGDGLTSAATERCDDGNKSDADACTSACIPARCGDGILWLGTEACDDGNILDGDGCSASCTEEAKPEVIEQKAEKNTANDASPPAQVPPHGCSLPAPSAPGAAFPALLLALAVAVRRRDRNRHTLTGSQAARQPGSQAARRV